MAFSGGLPGFTQPGGGEIIGSAYYWDAMDYQGATVLASGTHTGTLDGAVSAAKAALGDATAWFIVIRDSYGATVHSEGSDANAGQGKAPPTQGEGGAAEAGAGSGQEPTLSFPFKLTGWVWVWDNRTGDPRTWTGHATEPLIGETPGYGSADDAYNAGKAEGDSNPAAMKLTVTGTEAGFTGRSYIWTDRLQAAQNAVAKEKNDATGGYFSESGTLVLPPGEPVSIDDGFTIAATVAIAAAIIYAGYVLISRTVK